MKLASPPINAFPSPSIARARPPDQHEWGVNAEARHCHIIMGGFQFRGEPGSLAAYEPIP